MKLYLDSSALVKLIKREVESASLRRFLRRHRDERWATSDLARVEVVRAVAAAGPPAVALARRQLARFDQIHLERGLLDQAATLASGRVLRSLDAIHLAAALSIVDLRAIVTYDARMQDAATALGLVVEAPA